MNNPVPRRHALAAIGALLLVSTPFSAPSKASEISPPYKDFSGAWQVDRHRGPADRRGPPPEGRGDRLGPPPGGPGGPRGEDVKIDGVNVPGLDRGDARTYSIMTPEGKKAFAAMDPLDLPANNCKSPGLPSIAMTPNLQVWSQSGDTLTIHHEYYDTVREIHLDRRTHPANAAHTPLGDAVGWIDGDTLVIETTNLSALPGGLGRNAPGSDARKVVERYRLSPDKQTLWGQMTITDPKYLTRPIILRMKLLRQPEGTKIESFPCSIEGARSYLKKE